MDGPVSTFNSTAINNFGIDLFTEVLSGSTPGAGGVFISPASVMLALALLLNGASPGSLTFWQLLGCMNGLNMRNSSDAPTFNARSSSLRNVTDPSVQTLLDTNAVLQDLVRQMRISAVNEVDLKILNSMWLKQPYQFSPPYMKNIQEYIGGYAKSVKTAQQINAYVETAFKGHIESVVSSTEFSAADVGLLVNAVDFKSAWANKFSAAHTNRGSFVSSETGKPISCNMMHQVFNKFAAEYSGSPDSHQAIRIPLSGRGFYAIIIRPSNSSGVAAAAQLLRKGTLTWSRPAGGINVAMPRFNVTTVAGLRSPLKTLGISEVFDPTAAQMDAMVTNVGGGLRPPYVDAFRHVVWMNVNEDGAETQPKPVHGPMVVGGFETSNVAPIPVSFDRPFVFAVQHIRTSALAFLGAVSQPSTYIAPTSPLLTVDNTATMMHGSSGQLTAREGPIATPSETYAASNALITTVTSSAVTQRTSSLDAQPAVAQASINGKHSGASASLVGQSLLNVIVSSNGGIR